VDTARARMAWEHPVSACGDSSARIGKGRTAPGSHGRSCTSAGPTWRRDQTEEQISCKNACRKGKKGGGGGGRGACSTGEVGAEMYVLTIFGGACLDCQQVSWFGGGGGVFH